MGASATLRLGEALGDHRQITAPWLACDLEEAQRQLSAMDAAALEQSLTRLLQPLRLASGEQTLHFFSLSPYAQCMLLLLLRTASHRFPPEKAERLTTAAERGCGTAAQLSQLLAGPTSLPSCPDFLYSSNPVFPWAPKVRAPAEAAALLAEQRPEPLPATTAAAGTKRPSESPSQAGSGKRHHADAALRDSCELLRSELAVQERVAALSSECSTALQLVLAHLPQSSVVAADSGLDSLSDDALLLVVGEAVEPTTSFARSSAVARHLLLPALLRLEDGAPSRSLAGAVEHMGECSPASLVEGCLAPLLVARPGLSKGHAELIVRAAKAQLPAPTLPGVVDAACGALRLGGVDDAAATAAAAGAQWSEHTVAMLQAVVDAKPAPTFAAPTLGALARALLAAASGPALRSSAKLGRLLLSVAKGQGVSLGVDGRGLVRAAAEASTSFMSKPTLAALKKVG